jgi:hypothetical protein
MGLDNSLLSTLLHRCTFQWHNHTLLHSHIYKHCYSSVHGYDWYKLLILNSMFRLSLRGLNSSLTLTIVSYLGIARATSLLTVSICWVVLCCLYSTISHPCFCALEESCDIPTPFCGLDRVAFSGGCHTWLVITTYQQGYFCILCLCIYAPNIFCNMVSTGGYTLAHANNSESVPYFVSLFKWRHYSIASMLKPEDIEIKIWRPT